MSKVEPQAASPSVHDGDALVRSLASFVRSNVAVATAQPQISRANLDMRTPKPTPESKQQGTVDELEARKASLEFASAVGSIDLYLTLEKDTTKSGSSDMLGIMAAANALSASTAVAASAFSLGQAPVVQPVAAKWASLTNSPLLCSLDPGQVAYLQERLESSPVVRAYLSGNQEELKQALLNVAPPQPAGERPKAQEAAQANSSSLLGFLWSSTAAPATAPAVVKRPYSIDEDLLDIARFFEKLTLLRISSTPDRRFSTKLGAGFPKACSLSVFSSIKALELIQTQVTSITDWSAFGPQLVILVVHEGLSEKDASDLGFSLAAVTKGGKSQQKAVNLVPSLLHLNLSHNSLHGFSEDLSRSLRSVSYLDLSNNVFTSIPSELLHLPALRVLNLACNKITDIALPPQLGHLKFSNLEMLSLRKNSVEILSGIDRFPKLRAIDLSENNISEVFEIGRLAEVETIDEILIFNNPCTKIENYRLNILNYFKIRALNILLDGSLPSSSERKQIRAGLTIAAVVSNIVPSKVSGNRSYHRGKGQPVELGAGIPASSEVTKKKKKKIDPEKKKGAHKSDVVVLAHNSGQDLGTEADIGSDKDLEKINVEVSLPEEKSALSPELLVAPQLEKVSPETGKLEELAVGTPFMALFVHTPPLETSTYASPENSTYASTEKLTEVENTEATPFLNLEAIATENPTSVSGVTAEVPVSLLSTSLAESQFQMSPSRLRFSVDENFYEPAQEFSTPKSTISFDPPSFMPSIPDLPAVATSPDQISKAFLSAMTSETSSPSSTPPKTASSPWARISSNRNRLGRLAELQEKRLAPGSGSALSDTESNDPLIDSDDLLMSRSGKKGAKIKTVSRKQSVNVASSPSSSAFYSPKTSASQLPTLSADLPESGNEAPAVRQPEEPIIFAPTPVKVGSPSERPRSPLTLENLRRENGAPWFKMYEELRTQEKKAREAASAAEAAAVAATEAAKLASEAARIAERGFSPPPLPQNDTDPFEITSLSSIRRPLSPAHENSPPRAGYLNAIGPYRKVYDYGARSNLSSSGSPPTSKDQVTNIPIKIVKGRDEAALSDSGRSIHVTFAPSTISVIANPKPTRTVTSFSTMQRRSSSGPDVERGSSKDIKSLQLGSGSQGHDPFGALPPLNINPVGGGPSGSKSYYHPQSSTRKIENEQADIDQNTSGCTTPALSTSVPTPSPQLILSRPITTTTSYRRPKSGDSVSSRSDSISTFSYIRPMSSSYNSRSLMGRAASIFSGEGGGGAGSVFSGFSTLSRSNYNGSARDRQDLIEIPRAPSIPFRAINNSLQLHLKFRIFPDDTEKILVWVPGSFVNQHKPYIAEPAFGAALNPLDLLTVSGAKSMLKLGRSILSDVDLSASMASGNVVRKSVHRGGVLPVDRSGPIERAAYILLTDRALCLFVPTFSMPYDPRSTPFENGPVVLPHVADVAAQVRYDDPRRVLRLYKRIPLERLARVDVGPNRQYIAIHFVDDGRQRDNSGSMPGGVGTGDGAAAAGNKGGRANVDRNDAFDHSSGQSSAPVQRPTIESIVLLTRDRTLTSKIIDLLVTTLYDAEEHEAESDATNSKVIIPGAGGNKTVVLSRRRFKGPDGRVRLVNQDVEWSLRGLRDLVLLREGPKHIFWNNVRVDPLRDWKDAWVNEAEGARDAVGVKKKGWLGGLLDTFSSSSKSILPAQTAVGEASMGPVDVDSSADDGGSERADAQSESSGRPRRESMTAYSGNIITDADDDPAASDNVVLDKVNFEFLRLYQLVGWIVPHEDRERKASLDASQSRYPSTNPSPLPPLHRSSSQDQDSTSLPPDQLSDASVPEMVTSPPVKVTVHSLTLSATSDFIYLASERFDVWPPPLFPPEYHPPDVVNDSILSALTLPGNTDGVRSINAAAAPRMTGVSPSGALIVGGSDSSGPSSFLLSSSASSSSGFAGLEAGRVAADLSQDDHFKGLAADRVPQWSPPLRVGRVKDLIRCERWRTWRWTLNENVSQVREASVPEREVAMLIQNGAIGTVAVRGYDGVASKLQENTLRRKSADPSNSDGAGERLPPSSSSSSKRPSRKGRSSSGFGFGRTHSETGSTAGWEWWVRVVFAPPMEGGEEYWWDLVFSTLDGANEFLEYVRDVRGVKPDEEEAPVPRTNAFEEDGDEGDQDDVFGPSGVSGLDEIDMEIASVGSVSSASRKDGGHAGSFVALAAGSRDMRLKGRVRRDGVAFLIGDD
ncbi:hypothetical protein HDU67_006966 [Dinochytrium kinnereticum]|nr:hypothetical protein HDU67_006966 [Dinochytrium kinnereticum]